MASKKKPASKANGKVVGEVVDEEQDRPQAWLNAFKFKSGKDWKGNAGGRPKKKPITERYMADLEREAPDNVCHKLGLPCGSTFGDCATRATLLRSVVGKDVGHIKEIREAIEGKAAQSITMKHDVTDELALRLAEARKRKRAK